MPTPRSDAALVVQAALLGMPGVAPKRLFGAQAFFFGPRMFAFLTDDAAVLKLPPAERRAALEDGYGRPYLVGPREPFGRWLEVPLDEPGRVLHLARLAYAATRLPERDGPRRRRSRPARAGSGPKKPA
jgi:hypothetical protein